MAELISIVIPAFNQGIWLEACLDSVFSQSDKDLEVIVIDGGSRDRTIDVIEKNKNRLAYWVSEPDNGQSHALNKGFLQVSGEWSSWLNSDDLLLPDAITALRRAIRLQPEAQWFAGSGWFVDELGKKLKKYPAPESSLSADDISPWTAKWFAQPGTFFKRELFEKAGGRMREDLRYAMDLDLWLRFMKLTALHPIQHPMGAYRLHNASKTVAERPEMEVEVVRVLAEHLGLDAALARVEGMARNYFDMEKRYQRLTTDLKSPGGWLRIAKRRLRRLYV